MISVSERNNPGKDLRCSVSEKGGHVAWVLGNRKVTRANLTMTEAASKAETFCSRNDYPDMKTVSKESYGNIATCTLAPNRNGVICYPEIIKLQVARDNGDILGFDAINYLTFHEPAARTATEVKPSLSTAKLKQLVNPHLRITRVQLAQVLDEMYNKVTCYEVAGTQGKDRFLIYYNATTGKEEKIRCVDQNGNEIQ
jgi:germination protein YpeB